MIQLISKINEIKKSKIKLEIDNKIISFNNVNKSSYKEWFSELCFCLLTANTSAEMGIRIQTLFGYDGFTCNPSEDILANKLKKAGSRFYNRRAHFIFNACKYKKDIKEIISSLDKEEKRIWLVKNIKGLGMKESSHFLRNIGYLDYAIIDFHIVDLMIRFKLLKEKIVINQKSYIEIENKLNIISKKVNLSLGELDLYLWYFETGKILK
jgi:N-glycosylase/DNA lyase